MSAQVIGQNRTVFIEHKVHVIECAACSIDFGIGEDFMARRRRDHGTFYCPNGHANVYKGPSDTEKERDRLRQELEVSRSLAAREASRRRQAEDESRRKDYQARAAKGQLTKTKNRIAAGVCPCCNRTFQNLRRHMAGQHPEYTPEASS